jgi:hypothetical protein
MYIDLCMYVINFRLIYDAVSSSDYVTLNDRIWKEAVLHLRYYPGIYLDGLRITTKTS